MKTSFFGFTGWSPGVREEHSGRETLHIHSGGRGSRGQPEAFHQANKNFYPEQNGLFLFARTHSLTGVVAVVHDIDPSSERGAAAGPAPRVKHRPRTKRADQGRLAVHVPSLEGKCIKSCLILPAIKRGHGAHSISVRLT